MVNRLAAEELYAKNFELELGVRMVGARSSQQSKRHLLFTLLCTNTETAKSVWRVDAALHWLRVSFSLGFALVVFATCVWKAAHEYPRRRCQTPCSKISKLQRLKLVNYALSFTVELLEDVSGCSLVSKALMMPRHSVH